MLLKMCLHFIQYYTGLSQYILLYTHYSLANYKFFHWFFSFLSTNRKVAFITLEIKYSNVCWYGRWRYNDVALNNSTTSKYYLIWTDFPILFKQTLSHWSILLTTEVRIVGQPEKIRSNSSRWVIIYQIHNDG